MEVRFLGHRVLQPAPTTNAVQTNDGQRGECGDDDEELQHLVIDGGRKSAQGDIGQHDDAGHEERYPHLPAQQGLHDGGQQVQVHAGNQQLGHGEGNRIDQVRGIAKTLAHKLRHRAHLGAVVERHHHNAQKDHGRDGADPEVVHGLEAILHAIGGHTDDFHRAQVGRDEGQSGHPGGQSAAGEEEVDGARHAGLSGPADA